MEIKLSISITLIFRKGISMNISLDDNLKEAWLDVDRLVTGALGIRPQMVSMSSEADICFYKLDHNSVKVYDKLGNRELVCNNQESPKRQVLNLLVKVLRENEQAHLPWGILTGIRPMKLYRSFRGIMGIDDTHGRLLENFLLEDSKIQVLSQIYARQEEILQDIDLKNSLALYIGIPFCPSKCTYCTFLGYSNNNQERQEDFFQALMTELALIMQLIENSSYKLVSIYVGGGTPASLDARQIRELLSYLRKGNEKIEINFEAGRADCLDREKLELIHEAGISRLSINPQSFKDETLKLVNRQHSVQDFIDVYQLAREIGFDAINCDLIFGLPNEDISDIKNSLKYLDSLLPEAITIHSLAVKTKAKIKEEIILEDFHRTNLISQMLEYAGKWAGARDYKPYYMYRQKNIAGNHENIAYSKKGKESLYNILIMEELVPIVGVGCGAVSKLYGENRSYVRLANPTDPDYYIKNIDKLLEDKGRKIAELLTK